MVKISLCRAAGRIFAWAISGGIENASFEP
jgi:hypothetical protein